MSKKKPTAREILQEFYDDVKVSYGAGGGKDKLDEELLSWPDLAVTFKKASAYLYPDKRRPS
jgi:hypothetical protein